MLGIFGSFNKFKDRLFVMKSIKQNSNQKCNTFDVNDGFLAASWLANAPLSGTRMLDCQYDIALFSGDIIGFKSIPWNDILSIFRDGKHERLESYNGNFSIAYYNKEKRILMLASDRRSQHALYYGAFETSFAYSTEMSTFCRILQEKAVFNEEWLYDYLYFNYPVRQTTFIKNIYRMAPASILTFDFNTSKTMIQKYCEMFSRTPMLLQKPKSFELAFDTFKKNVVPYFSGSNEIACALTGGWDGRTMLAFAPEREKVTAYTYGVEGCRDLEAAAITAKKLNIKHKAIIFGNDFIEKLPDYIYDTIFLSSGLEKALRATLKYVYEQITNKSKELPLIISGIGLDGIFRGHSMIPAIVSNDMAVIFRSGYIDIRKEFWSFVFEDRFNSFKENIIDKLDYLRETFGDFKTPDHHILFKLYVTHPELFGGELKIAENYTTLRIPTWNDEVIALALSIKESALSYSEFTEHKRGDPSEVLLQSYLIKNAWPQLGKIPIETARPDIALKSSILRRQYRIYRGVGKRIKKIYKNISPLENWEQWLTVKQKEFVNDLFFSNSSHINNYISKKFVKNVLVDKNMHWIGKLLTIEILLRLISRNWQK